MNSVKPSGARSVKGRGRPAFAADDDDEDCCCRGALRITNAVEESILRLAFAGGVIDADDEAFDADDELDLLPSSLDDCF